MATAVLRHRTGGNPNEGATLVPLVSSAETSQNALCHGPADSGKTVSRSTTGHPPQHQARPAWHVLLWRLVPGTCAPSIGELLPEPLRLCVPHFTELLPFAWRALTTVVSTANWTPPENGESIDHHFQTTRVMHIWSSQIHVAHHDVGGDSTPCFVADTGCNLLHSESPSSPKPQHEHKLRGGGHWNRVEGHTGSCAQVKGRGRRRRQRRRIRNKCGSKRVTRHNGHVARANPEPTSTLRNASKLSMRRSIG